MADELVDVWRRILVDVFVGGEPVSWVLFEHGTCVVLTDPAGDPADQAIGMLREYGPVRIGTSSADMGTIEPDDGPGWVVTGHHPDILTYVGPGERRGGRSELAVGLIGRATRDADSHELTVVHVEDKRPNVDDADIAAAERAYQEAIDSGDGAQAAEAVFNLGWLRKQQGDVPGAAAAFQLVIDSGHAQHAPGAAFYLGALREEQGDVAGAAVKPAPARCDVSSSRTAGQPTTHVATSRAHRSGDLRNVARYGRFGRFRRNRNRDCHQAQWAVFHKTPEQWRALSNMAPGFLLTVNGVPLKSCRESNP